MRHRRAHPPEPRPLAEGALGRFHARSPRPVGIALHLAAQLVDAVHGSAAQTRTQS
jgi:hypothetical protein